MKYRMIGIDMDGTMLNEQGVVSLPVQHALRRAHEAGAMIVPATGRAWHESAKQLEPMEFLTTGVFVTGAAINDLQTGDAIDLAMIEPHLAQELVQPLLELDTPTLVFQDRALSGQDYLVVGALEVTGNTAWWFNQTQTQARFTMQTKPDDLHHVLRVGLVAKGSMVAQRCAWLTDTFGDRAIIHHFEAIHMPDDADCLHVLEMFAPGVDKWRGLTWLAHQHNIEPHEIAAIGDSINDLSMLSQAGCGIAMGNASEPAQQTAQHHAPPNTQDGLVYAIDQLLQGHW